MQQEGQPKRNDLVDAVITSAQKTISIEQKDGSITKETILDEDTIWTKLLSVASNTFGQLVFENKEWERSGNDAPRNMCHERAMDIMHDIVEVGQSIRRAIDAKSSESIGVDRRNTVTPLLGMIGKNKMERVYSVKEKVKNSLVDSIMGRDAEKDADED